MKKTTLTLFVLFFYFLGNSQNIDSLKMQLTKVLKAEKSYILKKIAQSYKNNMVLDSAILYYEKALTYNISDEEKSDLFEKIGMTYFYKNDFLISLEKFNNSLYYAKEIGYDSLIARRYSDIGVVYDYLGAYDKSTSYYYKALNIFEKQKDYPAIAKIYNNLGIINQNRRKHNEALKFYKKSLQIKTETNVDKIIIATSYVNIGSVYEDLNNYYKALKYYYKALGIFYKNKKQKYTSLVLGNIANVKLNNGELDSAIFYNSKAITINKIINNKLGLINNYKTNGKISIRKNKIDSSIFYYNKALNFADTLNVPSEKSKVLSELILSYKEKEDYKNAFLNLKKLAGIKDSINNEDTNNKIETLKIVYETEKKDKEISSLQKDIYEKRILLFIISITLILISFIIYLFLRQKLAKSKYEKDLFNQRLLRLQMNPHFIFNTLASIQSYMFEKDIKKAAIYLSAFSKLTRSILNNSREEFITLQEDIETTENYLNIQKMRFEDSFNYDIFIDNNMDAENVKVPPMLIQPFVENTVIHGFKNIKHTGEIKINYKKTDDIIEIIIEDNGSGFEKNINKANKSQALAITKERLKILNKNKKKLIAFQIINNKNKGVKVIFSIPFLTLKP